MESAVGLGRSSRFLLSHKSEEPWNRTVAKLLNEQQLKAGGDELIQQLGDRNMAYSDLRTNTRPDPRAFEYPLGVPISGVDVRDSVGPTFHFREWANEAGMRRNNDETALGTQYARCFVEERSDVIEIRECEHRYTTSEQA